MSRAQGHRSHNVLQTAVLLGGMALLLLLLGYALAGRSGAIFAAGSGVVLLWFSPRIAPGFIMRLYGARRVERGELREVQDILRWLADRAGLPRAPSLYYVPTRILNAFTAGDRTGAAVGLTDGLLRAMSPRELAGIWPTK